MHNKRAIVAVLDGKETTYRSQKEAIAGTGIDRLRMVAAADRGLTVRRRDRDQVWTFRWPEAGEVPEGRGIFAPAPPGRKKGKARWAAEVRPNPALAGDEGFASEKFARCTIERTIAALENKIAKLRGALEVLDG